ncbi:MAG TPA: DUF6502 family protein [Candidatus Binataceae bacterium]|nr:DUF6502 family protein [Candidatus Binataceae bacterium]
MTKTADSTGTKPDGRESDSDRTVLVRAALAAVEPVVELLLQLGITSPEAESLLRSLFVHKAREWLSKHTGGASASDVRVALVTGVHRNFVRQILSEPPAIARSRVGRGHPGGRLLQAWYSDPAYQDDNGTPRDLPEKGETPSFTALAAAYLPGAGPEGLLEEMLRAGAIESLSYHRVRVRSRTMRQPRLSVQNVTQFGQQGRAVLGALVGKLTEPRSGSFVESIPPVAIDVEHLAFVRNVIARRADAFLAQLGQELAMETRRNSKRGKRVSITLHVIESEGSDVSARRRRERKTR